MARFAVVDANNQIVSFTPKQLIYNPQKGDAIHPGPWRSLPADPVTPPDFDPATQVREGPTYTVNPNDVTESYSVRAMTPAELDAIKDREINAVDIAAFTVLFNHENRIRTLEAKAPITKAQFIAGVKALL